MITKPPISYVSRRLLLFCNSKIFTNLRFQLYYLPFVYSFNSSVNFSVSKPLFLLSLANSFNFSRSSSSLESLLDPELFCADLKYTSIKMYLLIDYISICKRHLAYLDLMTRACGGSGWTTELARSPWTNQSGGSCHVTALHQSQLTCTGLGSAAASLAGSRRRYWEPGTKMSRNRSLESSRRVSSRTKASTEKWRC